jgi:hypothetical protein
LPAPRRSDGWCERESVSASLRQLAANLQRTFEWIRRGWIVVGSLQQPTPQFHERNLRRAV